ncbi:MAG: IPT/TIG domain-containing protein [Candidatus Kapabacteria bacterium]|jgi:sugar lactone lactonase YvrE|nr:IPT/TIG domain-containing protein [Candidatus Kapabacteria bacterium]
MQLVRLRIARLFVIMLLIALDFVQGNAQSYQVTTIAGGVQGSVDGIGALAQFNFPTGITTNNSGVLYIGDWMNCRIRSVASGANVQTLAGSGFPGYQDGNGLNVRFQYPNGLAIDPTTGNIYVADRMNQLIRKITPAGDVTTFAGTYGVPGFADGIGTSARFNRPSDVAVDALGNVYVADDFNNRIRKITPLGEVTTLAGSGASGFTNGHSVSASFNRPVGIAIDGSGFIYVADYENNCIRKITPSGSVTTHAGGINGNRDGNGTSARFSLPTGLDVDFGGTVYVADRGNNRIRKIMPNGDVTTIAGSVLGYQDGTNALFNQPYSVAVDSQGNVYVVDTGNHRIRRISPIQVLIPSAAISGTGFNESAANNGGVLSTNIITLSDASWTSSVSNGATLTPGAHFLAANVPSGLTLVMTKLSDSQVQISFTGNALQHQASNNVANVQLTFTDAALNGTPAASVTGLNGTNLAITFLDNPRAIYSGTTFPEATANNGTITTKRTITLAFDTFVPTGAFVQGVHFTASGVPTGLTMTVTRASQTSAEIGFTGTAAAHESANDANVTLTFLNAALASGNAGAVLGLTPKSLAIDFDDTPIVGAAQYSDSVFTEAPINNGTISIKRTLTLTDVSFTNVGTFVQGTHFTAIGVPQGLTLVITRLTPTMAELSLTGVAQLHQNANDATLLLAFTAAALNGVNPASVQGLSPKNLHIDFRDIVCNEVTTFAGNGTSGLDDGIGTEASFGSPYSVTTDKQGNVYIGDEGRLRKITPGGVVTTIAGQNGGFGSINGVAIDFSGNLYTIELTEIKKVTPNGTVTNIPIPGVSMRSGSDIAVDAFGRIYFTDGENWIYKIMPDGGVSRVNNEPVVASGIAVDAVGNVYVGGYNRHRVYKVSTNGTLSVVAGTGIAGHNDGNAAQAQFNEPVGLTLDASGNIYVVDYVGGYIRKISTDGMVSTVAGSGSLGWVDGIANQASFNYPLHIALDTNGTMYVTDRLNYRIRSINVCGGGGSIAGAAEYNNTIFREAAANNGTIATSTHTITLGGTSWSQAVLSANVFRAGIDYTITNVPPGLSFNLVPISPTTAQMFFTGVATNHANINDAMLTLTFTNAAVSGGNVSAVLGLSPKVLTVDFNDPPQGAFALYSDTLFTETTANAGQITTTRTVTLTGASFVSGALTNGTHFTASNVPAGLTLTVTRLSATQVRLGFSGTASAHTAANSTDALLTFLPAAIQVGNVGIITNLSPRPLRVNFLDPYTATYSDTLFTEAIANDGTVPTTRTITLTGTTFTTTATTFVQGTHFNVSGVPAGLTLTVTKVSPTVARLAFTGTAAAHVNDALNINLSFLNAALSVGSAANVVGLTPRRLAIDFLPPYSAVYSGTTFVEAPANDGTVPTIRTLTIVGGDTLMGSGILTSGVHFQATGVPAGLTFVLQKTSATTAQMYFTGTAVSHTNADDVSFTLNILPAALASGNPSAVLDLTPRVMMLDFMSPNTPPPSSPNILGFTPQVGTTGTVVTVSGFGFTGAQNVLFGGTPASSFTVVSDSVVTAVVENGSTGDVTLVTANGLGILPGFTYVPRPTISSFTPTSGNAGQVVTINGANFKGTALNGTNWTTTSVYFGGTPATSFTVISATQIQATVGAGATGAVRVETLPGNVGVRNGFCYMAPIITAFAPTSASTGTQVVITGSNFTGATAVRFNGRAAASFTVISDTEIRAFAAANTPETGNISVTTPQCTDDLGTFTFIPAPVIYGFWLSGGTNGDVITIDGINFTGATGVKFGDTVAASYTVVSPTRITAVVGNGKTGAVSVIGPGGVGSRSKFIYYAPGAGRPNPPIITSFSPTEGPDGTVVTINGFNFQGADWFTTAVRIGDAPDGPRTAIIQSMTSTRLVVRVNGGATGLIRVYTPAGVTTSTQTFTYFPPPTITAFSPTTGGAGTTVTILGTSFNGVTAVRIGGVAVASYTVDSPTQISAVVGSGATGRVTVVANGGTATSASNFTFPTPPPAPVITSFTPAIATSGTVITINGSNFTAATQVSFGGTAAQSFTVVNASRITAVVGAGASGNVSVTTPSGTATKAGFTYLLRPLPTITSFSPASASVGQTVTIFGTYFTGATAVFMGSASVPFTVHHSGRITVEVPSNAASGVIRVVTPNGVAMRPGFTLITTLIAFERGSANLTSFQSAVPSAFVAESAELQESLSLGVYPNPAIEAATLRATGFGESREVNITVLNALGQVVMRLSQPALHGTVQARLDVRTLATGSYTAVLSDGTVRQTVRLMKQ